MEISTCGNPPWEFLEETDTISPKRLGAICFFAKNTMGRFLLVLIFCVGDPKHLYGGCVFFEVKFVRNSDPIKRQTGSD